MSGPCYGYEKEKKDPIWRAAYEKREKQKRDEYEENDKKWRERARFFMVVLHAYKKIYIYDICTIVKTHYEKLCVDDTEEKEKFWRENKIEVLIRLRDQMDSAARNENEWQVENQDYIDSLRTRVDRHEVRRIRGDKSDVLLEAIDQSVEEFAEARKVREHRFDPPSKPPRKPSTWSKIKGEFHDLVHSESSASSKAEKD